MRTVCHRDTKKQEMRHAYCIMAHGHPSVLAELVRRLDHPSNDIYIHIDKRADKSNVVSKITPPNTPSC